MNLIIRLINLKIFFYLIFTPNKCPTTAVTAIATVPQKQILTIAIPTLEPPVFAATAPKIIRKIIEKPYW